MDYTLHLGDCLDVMATMPDASIDLTVTSPPYDNLRTYGKDFDADAFDWHSIIDELYRLTKPGGVVVWIVADATINGSETGTSFRQALWAMECGFNLHDTMIYGKNNVGMYDPRNMRYKQAFEYMFVWSKGKVKTYNPIADKPNTNPGRSLSRSHGRKVNGEKRKPKDSIVQKEFQDRFNLWFYYTGKNLSTKDDIANSHPAILPEALARDHILSWSNPGDVVFDPMMGSGTTGKMAIANGRKFIGIELDAGYLEIAKQRIEAATMQMPLLREAAD